MIKWMIGFALAVILVGFMLDAYSQGSIVVVNSDGTVKEIIILPPPPPTW